MRVAPWRFRLRSLIGRFCQLSLQEVDFAGSLDETHQRSLQVLSLPGRVGWNPSLSS
jgi:hypothetical protein